MKTWGVFEIKNDDGSLKEIHVAPCDDSGASVYELKPDADTVDNVLDPAPMEGVLTYVHRHLQ